MRRVGWKKSILSKKIRQKKKNQGVITVFVTLIMVPVVAITAVMVDLSRLKLYSSQAAMAADAYGEAVLSEFDNLLKQLYGLFSVTQNEEGKQAIEELAKYASYSFYPNGDEKGLSGFMPYEKVEMKVEYEKVEGASLSNNNVLMTQISDFMKYRVVEEVLEEGGILNTLTQFDSLSSDMEAMEERSEITDSSAEALGKIDEYYAELKKLAAYPVYLKNRESAFLSYSNKLTEVINSDEYDDYVYYLEHKEEIEAVLKEFEEDEEDEDETEQGTEDEEDENLAEKTELYERFSEFDAEEYVKELRKELSRYSDSAENHDSEPIDFDNTGKVIDTLGNKTRELERILQTLKEQVERLKAQLDGCSEAVREGIEKEISELNDIIRISDEFRETYDLIAVVNDDKGWNKANKELMENEVPKLNAVKEKILKGEAEPKESYWAHTIPLFWYDFQDDKKSFYDQLRTMCDAGNDEDGDKNAGKKKIKQANKAQEDAEKELESSEETSARDISSALASQLKTSGASSEAVPNLTDYFSGGLSFQALSNAGSNVLDKFLVTTYDFGMFSSRVSGIRPEGEEGEGEYADFSLTKIKMSPDVNYLYGAELEYLFGGHNQSESNLNETRNIICGVRLTMNFASTYLIEEVNQAIQTIATTAAEAVAASGVGAAAAPLVHVAVSGALRMAFATIEMAGDWKSLKNREDVVLLKNELGDLMCADAIAGLLGMEIHNSSSSDRELKLSYENYLYVLLCLLVDDNTLLSRTSNLISLNVNQAMNQEETLTSLDFKMADTVTAVKSTCRVKADFVILPENFARMYYSNTKVKSKIEALEDHYFGYSVIRGY